MRKILVFLFTLVSIAAAGPAAGQKAVTVEVVDLKEKAVLTGRITLKAHATSAAGIKRIDISVNRIVVGKKEPAGYEQEVTLETQWNTTKRVGAEVPAGNGEYTILATATATGGVEDRDEVSVFVDNPPSIPTGLTAAADVDEVFLTWAPNPEPDVLGYTVERDSGDGFVSIAETESTSYIDTAAPGTYSYRVVVHRYSPVSKKGRSSVSDPVTATIASAAPVVGGSGGRDNTGGDEQGASGLKIDGERLGGSGLPASVDVSGGADLPSAPDIASPGTDLEWGTYGEELPLEIPQGGIPLARRAATPSSDGVVPPDGLRWVAVGLLFVATAALLRVLSVRLGITSPASDESALKGKERGPWSRVNDAWGAIGRQFHRRRGRHLATRSEDAGSFEPDPLLNHPPRRLGRNVGPWLFSSTKGNESPTSTEGAAPKRRPDRSS